MWHTWMILISSLLMRYIEQCALVVEPTVCFQCNSVLWLCLSWSEWSSELKLAAPPHHHHHLSTKSAISEQQRKLLLKLLIQKGMIALTVKVFYWCTVLHQARQIIGRQGATLWHYVWRQHTLCLSLFPSHTHSLMWFYSSDIDPDPLWSCS